MPTMSLTRPDTGTSPLPFDAGEVPPAPVPWLHPTQLLRSGYQAALSTLATGFLDRRETFAALPTTRAPRAEETRPKTHQAQTWLVASGEANDPTAYLALHPTLNDSDVWIDYIADIGDSWDATYASLSLLARPFLTVRGLVEEDARETGAAEVPNPASLPRGHLLVLGGDEVYPTPSRIQYRTRTRSALMAALPADNVHKPVPATTQRHERLNSENPPPGPALLAIPGNHDWYDGLTAFTREFCQGRAIGGWGLAQGRSYFAVKLHADWWLLGIDIALDSRIDKTQQTYFMHLMAEGEAKRVILCTAKPVWLDGPFRTTESYRNLAEFAELIRAHQNVTSVILAGDTHHYSHYERTVDGPSRPEHMIVCGGGGAYLSGTHQLEDAVLEVTHGPEEHRQHPKDEQPFILSPHSYPKRDVSVRLSLGAARLAFRSQNWSFVALLGLLYALFVQTLYRTPAARVLMTGSLDGFGSRLLKLLEAPVWPGVIVGALVVVLCAGVTWYANSGRAALRATWGTAHGLAHLAVALWLLAWAIHFRHRVDLHALDVVLGRSDVASPYLSIDFYAWRLAFVVVAGYAGATLVGVFLAVSDMLFGWHTNEAFVAQSIVDYRSMLRMRLTTKGQLTIYPIGLRKTPRRWRARPALTKPDDERVSAENYNPSLYESGDAVLEPHLIEGPIVIPS